MHDDEEELEKVRKVEAKHRQEIDKDLQSIEKLKSDKVNKKMECDAMEEEVGKARREVGSIAKDIQAAQKHVTSLETKIESKKSARHNILKQCKVSRLITPFFPRSYKLMF